MRIKYSQFKVNRQTFKQKLRDGFFNRRRSIYQYQPRSQGLFLGLGAGREKALASAGHVPT